MRLEVEWNMSDDEFLHENHPLQHYLKKVGLDDDSVLKQHGDLLSDVACRQTVTKRCAVLRVFVRFLYSPAFYFAHSIRKQTLDCLVDSALHSTEDHAFFQHFQQLCGVDLERARSHSILHFVLHMGMLSLCCFSSSWLVLVLSMLSLSFWVLCIAVTIWSCIIAQLVRYIIRHTTACQAQLRSCIIFLQDFEMHNTFGNMSALSCRSICVLQQRLQAYLDSEIQKLMEVALGFKVFSLSAEICSALSVDQMQVLRDAVQETQSSGRVSLNECKMFREIKLLLDSDVFSQVAGVFSILPNEKVTEWCQLSRLLWNWAHFLCSSRSELAEIDRLRMVLEQGHSVQFSEKKVETRNSCSGELQLAHQRAHNLLMHLLVGIQRARELKDAIECFDEDATLTVSAHLEHLGLQLKACENAREELVDMLLSAHNGQHSVSSSFVEADEPSIYMQQSATKDSPALDAKDPEPEDDVLEDVAIGEDESINEDDRNMGSDINTISGTPLHSSVLKELRVAIELRRLNMREREQRALEKRLHSGTATTCLESPGKLVKSESSNGQSDIDKAGQFQKKTTDGPLNSFFHGSDQPEERNSLMAVQKRLRNQCAWQAKSAVSKRVRLFRQSSCMAQVTAEESSQLNGHHTLINGAVPPVSRYPTNPFVANPSFAAALLARRRQVGFAEEESFAAVGTGEDALPDEKEDMLQQP